MSETTELQKLQIKQNAEARQKKKKTIIIITAAVVLAAVLVWLFLFLRYHKYTNVDVTATVEVSSSAGHVSMFRFGDGYIRCDNHNITYFSMNEVVWDFDVDMTNPVCDICEGYLAIADTKQSEVLIFDKNGLAGKAATLHSITDVEVSKEGKIALSTADDESNFIEIKDINGNEIINVKSVFSSSGYLSDISMSADGNRLAAAFIDVSQGTLLSKVLFYDFSKDSTNDMLVGGFSHYENCVMTTVNFLDDTTVAAIGDNAYTLYKFKDVPSILSEELDLDWEIQAVNFCDKNILFIVNDNTGANAYRAMVLNSSGKFVADFGFDFAFERAILTGSRLILTEDKECRMYSLDGIIKFDYTFGEKVLYITPSPRSNEYLVAESSCVNLIKLK